MEQQAAWAAGKPGVEDELLALEADSAAYSGRLRKAREFSRQAIDSAERQGNKETAATYSCRFWSAGSIVSVMQRKRDGGPLSDSRSAGRDCNTALHLP